ncbi:MAG: DNA polymerase III subunit alpha [Candidatus Shikimatogenerans bostrichidophilus]|nr:MAG: DNA polymerase III subunit alpha [Candidatus Shikimatogenerans bostrichidophilus]
MNFAGSIPALDIKIKYMLLFIDTETTGLPINNIFEKKNIYKWPRLIQISWQMYNKYGNLISNKNYYIKLKNNYKITIESFNIHGINKRFLNKNGKNIKYVLNEFYNYLKRSKYLIGFNIGFDINILISEYFRYNNKKPIRILKKKKKIDIQKILLFNYNKWISLEKLYSIFYGYNKYRLHNSYIDINITILCFLKLLYYKILIFNFKFNILNIYNNIPLLKEVKQKKICNHNMNKEILFFNIHNHTHYNILSSTIKIHGLINKAIKYNMKAVGICDNNMMGAFEFIKEINKINKIKGILSYNIFIRDKNKFFNHVLVVKNTIGYYNLIKISTHSYLYNCYSFDNNKNNNIYYIDKKTVKKYSKGLIFLTGNLNSEISYYIIKNKIKKAEKILLYWKKIFNKDIYIEIFINKIKNENKVNKVLLKFSKKHNILYINQYDSYYLNKKDYIYNDILFCIKNKITFLEDIKEEKKKYIKRLPNNNFYFKKYIDIKELYKNYKEGFYNLKEIYDKIENIKFKNNILLPKKFDIPSKIKNKYNKDEVNYYYLKYLTYKGAKKKYGKLNKKIILRIKKELNLIRIKEFTNYFLIVKDIIEIAKKHDVDIGPGRGSVAGSIIAYCLDITKIDPLKYKLLFERFLNIYRKKMPDIDLDLNYKTRKILINHLIKKYNKSYVSYIITYGKIGAKTAIRDCSRVFNLPLSNVSYLTSLIENKGSIKDLLNKINKKKNYINEKDYKKIYYFNKIMNVKISLDSFVLNIAKNLENLIRNIGVHACGIIISNEKLNNYIPLLKVYNNSMNKDIIITQYDSISIENLGLLKIDLLGLRTLAVIKESLLKIKKNKKKFKLNLKDKHTYRLFHNNQTTGIFQYESKGIKIIASTFKARKFKELIDFNALYRPGPLQYIPIYIKRKNGIEKVEYDLPIMKKYLKDTYGITIYQEQVILLAKIISGINEYEADLLREAIAKKNKIALSTLKDKFFNNSLKKGYSINILNKIWTDWESFVSYAFNKSHATCYAYLTYKTAYLKRNYEKEFWSSILNNYIQNSKKQSVLLNEAINMGLRFLLPNINESTNEFIVYKNKYIRYSLSGIKGLGEKSTLSILKSRSSTKFRSILDFLYRVDLRIINKRLIKILILTGSLDVFKISRFKYFLHDSTHNIPKIELLIKSISLYKKQNKTYSFIKKKFKNYFEIDNTLEKKNKNDINIIEYNRKEIEYLGGNLFKDLYYKKYIIFNIINLIEYKTISTVNNVILLSGIILKFYKYRNIYNLKILYYDNNKKIFQNINIDNNKIDIVKKKINKDIYKNNIIVLKIFNNKIYDIRILKKLLKGIKSLYIKIYKKFYYNSCYRIIKNIIKLLKNIKSKNIKCIYFKVYNKKKEIIYKKKYKTKLNINILYKIKKKYPNLYIKI